jgi:hypothetical protein
MPLFAINTKQRRFVVVVVVVIVFIAVAAAIVTVAAVLLGRSHSATATKQIAILSHSRPNRHNRHNRHSHSRPKSNLNTYGCYNGRCTMGEGIMTNTQCSKTGCTTAPSLYYCLNGACKLGDATNPGDYTEAECQQTPSPCAPPAGNSCTGINAGTNYNIHSYTGVQVKTDLDDASGVNIYYSQTSDDVEETNTSDWTLVQNTGQSTTTFCGNTAFAFYDLDDNLINTFQPCCGAGEPNSSSSNTLTVSYDDPAVPIITITERV